MAELTGLLQSLAAAVQASLSVLLVIFYGGVAAHLQLLSPSATKTISKVCVRMFLPALLIVKIGSQLDAGSASRYGLILAWAVICHSLSFLVGAFAHLVLGMPDWTTAAIMFNNTTSYPLLLVAALDETGILAALVAHPERETTAEALERARSYFLVFATVSSCLTFAVGPRLIDSEHAPEPETDEDREDDEADDKANVDDANDDEHRPLLQRFGDSDATVHDETTALLSSRPSVVRFSNPFSASASNSFFPSTRRSSLAARSGSHSGSGSPLMLPTASSSHASLRQMWQTTDGASSPRATTRGESSSSLHGPRAGSPSTPARLPRSARLVGGDDPGRRPSLVPRPLWRRYLRQRLSPRAKWWLVLLSDFLNAPLLGALAGAVIGLTPPLQRAFFADTADGGVFTAWLTASLKNIGSLFVPLPVVVAGVSLYVAMKEAMAQRKAALKARQMEREDLNDSDDDIVKPRAGSLPWGTVIFILTVRFVVWPVISIGSVYALARVRVGLGETDFLLGEDPMFWFAMMLMPTGPPAMRLITLVQVSDAGDEDESNIAKLLTVGPRNHIIRWQWPLTST